MILGKKIWVKIFKKTSQTKNQKKKKMQFLSGKTLKIVLEKSTSLEQKCINNLKYFFSKSFVKNVSKKYKFFKGEFL